MAAILDISIGEGVLTYFVFVLVINVFHIWLYGHPLEAIGVQLFLKKDCITSLLREPIATCDYDFSEGTPVFPLDPQMIKTRRFGE